MLLECELLQRNLVILIIADVNISTAYDASQPFTELLTNAMVLPIFDGGNVGIRRRHLQNLMLKSDYDAWAATYGPSK